jgi:hypothetical protein
MKRHAPLLVAVLCFSACAQSSPGRQTGTPDYALAALIGTVLVLDTVDGPPSAEERELDAARAEAAGTLAAAGCDLDDTIATRPAVQEACNAARAACYGDSTPELLPTANGCRAALAVVARHCEVEARR